MIEVFRPEPLPPFCCELVGYSLTGEFQPVGSRPLVHYLKVPQLVQKDIVEQKASHCLRRPLHAALGSKLLGCLPRNQGPRQAHPRWQGAQDDLTAASRDVAEGAPTATPIVEVDRAKSLVQLGWKAAQEHAHVLLRHVMDSVSAWT
jgi:hypothetical protein